MTCLGTRKKLNTVWLRSRSRKLRGDELVRQCGETWVPGESQWLDILWRKDGGVKLKCCRSSGDDLVVGGGTAWGLPWGSEVRNPFPMQESLPAMQETQVRSLGQEDSPGEGNGNPLQYSSLGNPMDRGARRATVQGVARSRTRLKRLNPQHPGTAWGAGRKKTLPSSSSPLPDAFAQGSGLPAPALELSKPQPT